MNFFSAAFRIVVQGIEKGFQKDPRDPGNWTSGVVGDGLLKGTNYGISAAAYPHLDIENLSIEAVRDVYERDYWKKSGCESMPWERALCVFDCAVNQGEGAEQLLNAHAHDAVELMAQRSLRYARAKDFGLFGHEWMRRLFQVMQAAQRTPE